MASVKATPKLPTYHVSATIHYRTLYWGVFDDESHLICWHTKKKSALKFIDLQAEHGKCRAAPWTTRRGGYMRRQGKN